MDGWMDGLMEGWMDS